MKVTFTHSSRNLENGQKAADSLRRRQVALVSGGSWFRSEDAATYFSIGVRESEKESKREREKERGSGRPCCVGQLPLIT